MMNHSVLISIVELTEKINHLESYLADCTVEEAVTDKMRKDAIYMALFIIATIMNQLPDDIKHHFDPTDLKQMENLSTKIPEAYYHVDFTMIWDIATNEVPRLKQQLDRLLNAA